MIEFNKLRGLDALCFMLVNGGGEQQVAAAAGLEVFSNLSDAARLELSHMPAAIYTLVEIVQQQADAPPALLDAAAGVLANVALGSDTVVARLVENGLVEALAEVVMRQVR